MAKDFDAILRESKEGDTIDLQQGIYITQGYSANPSLPYRGEKPKRGCKIMAEAPGATVIQCVREITAEDPDASVIASDEDDVELFGLTVDGGMEPGKEYAGKRNLIFLTGNNTKINNCVGRNQYGSKKRGAESFGFRVSGKSIDRCLIVDCFITDPHGDYITQFRGNWISFCKAHFPKRSEPGERGFMVAFNMGDTDHGAVLNCEAYGAMAAVYMDYKDCTDLTVQGNHFESVETGLWVNAEQSEGQQHSRTNRGITLMRNRIYLDPSRREVAGILLDHRWTNDPNRETTMNCVNDVRIERNVFDFAPGERLNEFTYAANVFTRTPRSKRNAVLGIGRVEFVDNETHPDLKWQVVREPDAI